MNKILKGMIFHNFLRIPIIIISYPFRIIRFICDFVIEGLDELNWKYGLFIKNKMNLKN